MNKNTLQDLVKGKYGRKIAYANVEEVDQSNILEVVGETLGIFYFNKQVTKYFNKMEKAWNTPEQIMARALKMASQSIESLKDRCKFLGDQVIEQQQIITELQPKANYVDKILQSKSLVTITQIAKDYGMSGRKFNQILKELKIQYKVGGQWVLYSKYQNNGYVHSRTIDITRTDGRPDVAMQTEWSQKGRLFLYEELKKHGYVPVIEQAA